MVGLWTTLGTEGAKSQSSDKEKVANVFHNGGETRLKTRAMGQPWDRWLARPKGHCLSRTWANPGVTMSAPPLGMASSADSQALPNTQR